MSEPVDTQAMVDSLKAAINLIETHFSKGVTQKNPAHFDVDTQPTLSFEKQMEHIRANNEALANMVAELKEMAEKRGVE